MIVYIQQQIVRDNQTIQRAGPKSCKNGVEQMGEGAWGENAYICCQIVQMGSMGVISVIQRAGRVCVMLLQVVLSR